MNFRSLIAASFATAAALVGGCSGAESSAEESRPDEQSVTPAPPQNSASGGAVACPAHPPKVEAGKLMVFDEAAGAYAEYRVKGMAYSPEASNFPGGQAKDDGTLCRWAGPLGKDGDTWGMSSCFDSDYAGTLMSLSGKARNEDFRANWQRDLKAMKEMGVNTIRLYNANPQFRDHKQFLDDVHALGMKVMWPAWYIPFNAGTDWPFERGTGTDKLAIQDGVDRQLAEVAAHPAVLLFTVGNELIPGIDGVINYAKTDDLGRFRLARINKIIDQIHSVCDGKLLTTNVPQDLGDRAENWESYAAGVPNQDLFVVNAGYRGDPKFGGYATLWKYVEGITSKYDKPLIIGETGEYDDKPLGNEWFEALVQDIDTNARPNVKVAGATFFEYSDEPVLKSDNGANPQSNEQHMGVMQLQPDPANKVLEKRVPRQERFDMVKRAFTK